MEIEYITKEKKSALENELNDLTVNKRKEVAAALEYARSLGDLSENAEYNQAREDQAHLEDRIREIETILKNAEVTDSNANSKNKVEVGSKVVVTKKGERSEKTFIIVGSEEASVEEGKISNESPLGAALVGHEKGDTVKFVGGNGAEIEYIIKDIE